jgi:hypothetical protein
VKESDDAPLIRPTKKFVINPWVTLVALFLFAGDRLQHFNIHSLTFSLFQTAALALTLNCQIILDSYNPSLYVTNLQSSAVTL